MAVTWAEHEGWNPGLDDAAAFFNTDPQGFLAAEVGGEMIGGISAVRYGPDFGFVGFYIVKPGFRGHKHGWALAEKAFARLGNRTIGIDGVLNKQRQYARFFDFDFAYRNIRFTGTLPGGGHRPGMVPLAAVPWEELVSYDARHFPAERAGFLRHWMALPHGAGVALRSGGRLAGYGVIRKCCEGFKIGPLFCDHADGAQEILLELACHAGGAPVSLDVPEVNAEGVLLAGRYGMREVFATARMYRGPAPALPLEEIFGVTSFELG